MTPPHTLTLRLAIIASLPVLASLPACTTGPGRCVGAAAQSVQTSNQKVLLNLDKDGIAIQGYDPVAYFTDNKPIQGDPKIRSTTPQGAVYYFASTANKAKFDATPSKYEPQFGGWCAYAASINALSPIDPKYWEVVDGRLLLQHNQKAWDLWHKDASGNLVKADKNWPALIDKNGTPPRALLNLDKDGLALEGYDPTSYFLDAKPRKGDPTLSRMYQGATYYFVDTDHKNAFEKDPSKFVPKFGGFCGYAASINKVSPVNPEIWQLVDGQLVLQHTPKAYDLFNKNVTANYAKAEKYWPGLSHRRCN